LSSFLLLSSPTFSSPIFIGCLANLEGEFFAPSDSVDFNRYAQNNDEGVTTIPLCQTEFNSCSYDTSLAYAIRHPDWGVNTLGNDVALIILPEGLEIIQPIRPVRLNRNPNVPKVGQELEVFGWGQTSNFPNEEVPSEI
jgi:hypothetical protein